MTVTSTLTKAALGRAVLEHIEANPQEWRQDSWAWMNDCGTTYCFAGHAVHLAHPEAMFLFGSDTVSREAILVQLPGELNVRIEALARELLGLDEHSADVMFELSNTLAHLHAYVEQMEQPGFTGRLICVNPAYVAIDPYDKDES